MVTVDDPLPLAANDTVLTLSEGLSVDEEDEASKTTSPEKPLRLRRVTVEVPVEPCWIVSEVELAAIEKSSTETETVVERVKDWFVPVTVTV